MSSLRVAAGALLGAAGTAILFAAISFALVLGVAPDFGFAAFLAVGSGLLLVASFGALAGGFSAWLLAGHTASRRARRLSAAFLGVCGLGVAAGIAAAGYTYRTEYAESDRDRWIAARQRSMDESKAIELAGVLHACAEQWPDDVLYSLTQRCRVPYPQTDPVTLAPDALQADAGWRWRSIFDEEWTVIIEPAVSLLREGPIFELRPGGRLLRRERPGAEPTVVW